MNVCQVMGGDEEGGLETHVVDLANGLAGLDDNVTVIAHRRYGERLDGRVRFLPLDLSRSRHSPILRRQLRKRIEAASPQVVHAHAGKAAALLATIGPAAATVGTIHGMKKNRSAYVRFDAVIGVSPDVLQGFDHAAKSVVYNGVAPAPVAMAPAVLRRTFGISEKQTVTLAVGRLVPVKGYRRLVELWDAGLGHLLIVGDGPERRRLQGLATGKPITLTGFRADARALMGGADLMVFASEREGFSYAFAEALLARLPVVSTPVPGAKDLLPREHLATIGELKNAIRNCLADRDAATARMADAFGQAAATLTVAHMVQATRAVYARVAA